MGPLMIDVHGTSLTNEDKEILQHPLVGGFILFSRNFESPEQLVDLTLQIRKNSGDILIAVDHEGGRVQRFRDGFSKIPAMGKLWQASAGNIELAQNFATSAGQLMALEVRAVGIDISFAPVLDVNGISAVIGDRAFHENPEIVTYLAQAFIHGMKSVGMLATGKHFPGHGSVQEDSHIAMPVDTRTMAEISEYDLQPFKQLIQQSHIAAMMPAHIVFPEVDSQAVGFSQYWLQNVLRQQLGFDGVIFSDDLSMAGAGVIGGFVERAEAAQAAGCDMLLMCNDREAMIHVIDKANLECNKLSSARLHKMLAQHSAITPWSRLALNATWQQAKQNVANIHQQLNK